LIKLRIDQPVWCSIHRLTARAANTMVRCASMESRLRWQADRACRSLLAIRKLFTKTKAGGRWLSLVSSW
jgi:hypothetical protein